MDAATTTTNRASRPYLLLIGATFVCISAYYLLDFGFYLNAGPTWLSTVYNWTWPYLLFASKCAAFAFLAAVLIRPTIHDKWIGYSIAWYACLEIGQTVLAFANLLGSETQSSSMPYVGVPYYAIIFQSLVNGPILALLAWSLIARPKISKTIAVVLIAIIWIPNVRYFVEPNNPAFLAQWPQFTDRNELNRYDSYEAGIESGDEEFIVNEETGYGFEVVSKDANGHTTLYLVSVPGWREYIFNFLSRWLMPVALLAYLFVPFSWIQRMRAYVDQSFGHTSNAEEQEP